MEKEELTTFPNGSLLTQDEAQGELRNAFEIFNSFKDDFEYTQRHTKSYAQRMWEIIKTENVTYPGTDGKPITCLVRNREHFAEATGLSPSTYDRIKGAAMADNEREDNERSIKKIAEKERAQSDEKLYVPGLVTFMTLCIVYQLNITMVKELRRSYGYDFNARDRVHQAYVYLLVNCRGKSIFYCNKVLEALKIDRKYYLGQERLPKR